MELFLSLARGGAQCQENWMKPGPSSIKSVPTPPRVFALAPQNTTALFSQMNKSSMRVPCKWRRLTFPSLRVKVSRRPGAPRQRPCLNKRSPCYFRAQRRFGDRKKKIKIKRGLEVNGRAGPAVPRQDLSPPACVSWRAWRLIKNGGGNYGFN